MSLLLFSVFTVESLFEPEPLPVLAAVADVPHAQLGQSALGADTGIAVSCAFSSAGADETDFATAEAVRATGAGEAF